MKDQNQEYSRDEWKNILRSEIVTASVGNAVEKARAYFDKVGVECKICSKKSFSPSEAIMEVCEEIGCDLIFMASHGRKGIAAVLLGSETQKVLTHSKVPVMVFR